MGWNQSRKIGRCKQCDRPFTWCDKAGAFCSNRCRQQAFRDRRKIDAAVKATIASMSSSVK